MNLIEVASRGVATKGKTVEDMANEALATLTLLEESNSPRTPISTVPLTWGVELEFVFAFHESKLKLEHLWAGGDVYYQSLIKKNLPYKFRRYTPGFKNLIAYDILPDRVYNSWAIHNQARFGAPTRPYHREAEDILSKVLENKCSGIEHRVEASIPVDEKEKSMYDAWLVMRDYSVCGVGSQNIPTWLPKVDSTTDWDSYGLELVSPIFKTDSDQGMNEIARILDAVKGKSSDLTGAFITNQCGLHVHIQASDSLDALKELAVILIVYEAEIAKLHPHCRRPEHPNSRYAVESNRLYFLHQDKENPRRTTYGEFDVSNEALAREPREFLENEVRGQISRCQEIGELALLMNWPTHGLGNEEGNRNRQVNFTAAARPPESPCTIEFRQARGTLDAKDVEKWVEFCVGLVRLAQYYVDNPGTFPIKSFKSFSVEKNGDYLRERLYIVDLMNDMGMSEEDKDYWRERIARYQARGGPLDRLDNEVPPSDGQEGQGIPGGGGSDGPGDGPRVGPSGSDPQGDNAGGSNPGRSNLGGNSDSGDSAPPSPSPNGEKSPTGNSDRSSAEEEEDDEENYDVAGSLPPPPQKGKKPPPATGKKRPAEDEDDQERTQPKKHKKDPADNETQNSDASVTTQLTIPGSEDEAGQIQNDQTSNPSGNTADSGAGSASSTTNSLQASPANATQWLQVLNEIIQAYRLAASARPAPLAPVIPPDLDQPSPGMVAPVPYLSPDEAHFFTGAVWAVQGFNFNQWRVEYTSIFIQTPTGQRSYVCAINAIIQSMRSQYPDSPFNRISAHGLLAMFDNLVGRVANNDEEDDELALLVDTWTGGTFQVVVVSSAENHSIARRAGDLNQQRSYGKNLYVHHIADPLRGGGGHWEGMRRRRPGEQ